MNILLVNKYYPPKIGGIEFHVQDLAEALSVAGHEVRVLVCNEHDFDAREMKNGVDVIRVSRLFEAASTPVALGFKEALEEHAAWADLVHFHFPYPFGEFEWLRTDAFKLKRVPYLVTYHSDIVRQKLALYFYQPYLSRFLDGARAIIASSPNLIQHSEELSARKAKCRHINFGLKVKEIAFNEEALARAAQIREERGKPFVLFIGRLVYYKGVDFLVSSMRENNLDYVVIGSGPLRAQMEAIATEQGSYDRLHFIEKAEYGELIAWLHAADVLALPSVRPSEAFGLVQIEAHAARTPTVSTNLKSGVPYANLDGITGLVVEPADAKALGLALKRLCEDRTLHDELAVQAQARALSDFTIEGMRDATLELYAEILEE